MPDLDWNDLRIVLAIADAGSLAGAARVLQVNHTTALRRLDALEARLGTRLFERQRSGYLPTEGGELIAGEARAFAPRVDDLERRLLGRDLRLTGQVRVTTAFITMCYLLPQPLAAFARRHPDIEVEVVESGALLDLSRRQADVALRISNQVPEHWLGRTLGTVRFRVYARRAGRGLPRRATALATLLRSSSWIAFERDIAANRFGRWMQERIPAAQVRARIDNFNSMAAMLRTGLGIGVLPTVIEPTEPDLVPISGEIDEIATPLWILCHPDLRRTARIQAFMREVGEGLSAALEAAPRA